MERTVSLICIIIVLGCLPAYSFDSHDQSPGDELTSFTVQSFFPFSERINWRYERTSREGVSHYTTKYVGTYTKDMEILHILSNPFGASYYEITPQSLIIKGIAPAEDIKNVNFYEEGELIRLKTPLQRGTRWQDRAMLEKNEEIIITAYDTEILGWDKVKVPAGEFDTLVTSSTQHTVFIQKKSGEGKGVFTFEQVWYGIEKGVVRRDIYLLYPDDIRLHLRDDKLEEFILEEKRKD